MAKSLPKFAVMMKPLGHMYVLCTEINMQDKNTVSEMGEIKLENIFSPHAQH